MCAPVALWLHAMELATVSMIALLAATAAQPVEVKPLQWAKEQGQTSAGRTTVGRLDRVGLLAFDTITVEPTSQAKGMRWQAHFASDARPGLWGAMASDGKLQRLAKIPGDSLGWLALRVKPAALWRVVQVLMSYDRPLESTLVQVQLAAAEQSLGVRFADALGEGPQPLFITQRKDNSFLGILGVTEGKGVAALLQSMGNLAQQVLPEARCSATASQLVCGGWRIVVKGNHILFSNSADMPDTVQWTAVGAAPSKDASPSDVLLALGEGSYDAKQHPPTVAGVPLTVESLQGKKALFYLRDAGGSLVADLLRKK